MTVPGGADGADDGAEVGAVREATRRFLAAESPPDADAHVVVGDAGCSRESWRRMATTLGLQGIRVDERRGGAGMGLAAELAVHEEMGRAVHGGPFLAVVGHGLPVLAAIDGGARVDELVTAVVAGEDVLVPLLAEGDVTAGVDGHEVRLRGTVRLVVAATEADAFLVAAGTDDGGVVLARVERGALGVVVERRDALDLTRTVADVVLDGAVGEVLAVGEGARRALEARDHGVLATCAESVGVADQALATAVGYLGVREQFGRRLGEFQALKHRVADLYVQVESARSALAFAVAGLDDPDPLRRAAALAVARRRCGSVAFHVAREGIQLHGGIGFTWEHPAHLYYRRAKANEVALDPRGEQTRVLATSLRALFARARLADA